MAAPFSLDLRRRVVAAFRSGVSRADTAKLFDVSESSVQRWARLKRKKGSEAAMPMGGKRPFALAAERDRLLARIAARPDIPLRALLVELRDRDVKASYFALWNIIDRAGLSFKKKTCTQANRTVRKWPGDGCNGRHAKALSIRGGLSSLMKPGRRPT